MTVPTAPHDARCAGQAPRYATRRAGEPVFTECRRPQSVEMDCTRHCTQHGTVPRVFPGLPDDALP
jgi:hypothetical protein